MLLLKFKSNMSYTEEQLAKDLEQNEYKYGFSINIESETIPKGLNEEVIKLISSKKK